MVRVLTPFMRGKKGFPGRVHRVKALVNLFFVSLLGPRWNSPKTSSSFPQVHADLESFLRILSVRMIFLSFSGFQALPHRPFQAHDCLKGCLYSSFLVLTSMLEQPLAGLAAQALPLLFIQVLDKTWRGAETLMFLLEGCHEGAF